MKCLPHPSFVQGWVHLYYGGDDDVMRDSELQNWITDINAHAFMHDSGVLVCVWAVVDSLMLW